MPDLYRGIEHCRSCGSDNLDEVLDLGSHCLSNFLEPGEPQPPKVPLIMARCANCTLVQLMHTVDRERLFRRYWYHSGGNESMVAALKDVIRDVYDRVYPSTFTSVLDIGANDGTLLRLAREQWPDCYDVGIEPSDIDPVGAALAIKGFFPDVVPICKSFKVITSIACFYASDDPNGFAAAIKRILHPEGVWVLQLQDLDSVVRDRAFDYVCHEHLTLWDPWSLDRLLAQHGLEIGDISRNDVNGGSVRFTIRHGHKRFPGKPTPHDWDAFKQDIEANKDHVLLFLERSRHRGLKVGGLAASTKFNTVLQYYGLGPEHIAAIGERNPDKVGRTTVTGIPIVSEEAFRICKPDYAVIGAWQFRESIMRREAEMSLRGTRFLTLIPALHTWDQEWLAA